MKKKKNKKIVPTASEIWKFIREAIETIVNVIAIYEFVKHLMQ